MRLAASVPATTANLGPGFDALGLALDLRNEVEAEVVADLPGHVEIHVEGEGVGELPAGPSHLLFRALLRSLRDRGQEPPGLRITQVNRIPLARGLGSSAAAIVAGLALAARLLGEVDWVPRALRLATEMEGHPDNVAPALLGGLVTSAITEGGVMAAPLALHEDWRVALAIPSFEVSTQQARQRLPQLVPHADATHNLTRLGLLLAGLQRGDSSLVRFGVSDRLHQPYRAALVPGFQEALEAAMAEGAAGAFLSGSGSTLAALVDARLADASEVAHAMARALERHGNPSRALGVSPSAEGVRFP